MKIRTTLTALAVAALGLSAAGCGPDTDDEKGAKPTSATTTKAPITAVPAAPYTTAKRQMRPGEYEVTMTVETDDTEALRSAFKHMAGELISTQDQAAYFVYIDCGLPILGDSNQNRRQRLGVGKLAVGDLAAARTGLKSMQSDVTFNPYAFCRSTPLPVTTVDSTRPLDESTALDLCTAALEHKYVADQLPLTVDAKPQKVQSWYVVSGIAKGHQTPGRTEIADMDFTCTAAPDPIGVPTAGVTKFEAHPEPRPTK